MQNYKVIGVQWFGAYKRGAVLPEWVVARAGSVPEQVSRGIVEATHEAVNVDIKIPEPKPTSDGPPVAAVEQFNAQRTELESANGQLKLLADQNAALKANLATRDKALGAQTDEIEHLKEACESHQGQCDALEKQVADLKDANAKLTADLDAATAPTEQKRTTRKPSQPALV